MTPILSVCKPCTTRSFPAVLLIIVIYKLTLKVNQECRLFLSDRQQDYLQWAGRRSVYFPFPGHSPTQCLIHTQSWLQEESVWHTGRPAASTGLLLLLHTEVHERDVDPLTGRGTDEPGSWYRTAVWIRRVGAGKLATESLDFCWQTISWTPIMSVSGFHYWKRNSDINQGLHSLIGIIMLKRFIMFWLYLVSNLIFVYSNIVFLCLYYEPCNQ